MGITETSTLHDALQNTVLDYSPLEICLSMYVFVCSLVCLACFKLTTGSGIALYFKSLVLKGILGEGLGLKKIGLI